MGPVTSTEAPDVVLPDLAERRDRRRSLLVSRMGHLRLHATPRWSGRTWSPA
jgi:hypothetical protein